YQPGKVDAVHLITHGSEGQIDFGSGVLNSTTMRDTYAAQLAKIGESLGKDADILVYGCDFGKGDGGRDAAALLSELTGADVAASTNATGDTALGGDWNLELQQGRIEADVIVDRAAQETWHDVLAVHLLDFDTQTAWGAGTSKALTTDMGTITVSYTAGSLSGLPALRSAYTGGIAGNTQNALLFTLGAAATTTITIDFSALPGGSVSNVGFALYDVDNAEVATFSSNAGGPTNLAFSRANTVSGSSVIGNGLAVGSTSGDGNMYAYFNRSGISSISFTYAGPQGTIVVLNDITFMGSNISPPVVDLDTTTAATRTASDSFTTRSYGNQSTGASTIPWSGDWVETDSGAAGGVAAGNIQVVASGADYALRLNNSTSAAQYNGAVRPIDLSGYSNSSIAFTYNAVGAAGAPLTAADAVVVEVSTNGGTNYTTLKTYTGAVSGTEANLSLAGYESASTVIRFRVSGAGAYTQAGDYFYVDNLSISGTPTGSANTYIEGDTTGVLIAPLANATVTDATLAAGVAEKMASAKVTIAGVLAGDVLTFDTAGTGITGAYNAATGVLTLTGLDTQAGYQAVINSVRYKSTSDDPTSGGARVTRNVAVTVTDSGGNEGNTATSVITVIAQNDAPTNTLAASYATNEDTSLALTGLSIADPDAGAGAMTVTLSVDSGSLSATAGGSVTVANSGTGSITLTGTLANINTFLASASRPTFTPTANFNGAVTLTMVTDDGGNAGAGGALLDTDTRTITVNAVADAPVNSVPTVSGTGLNTPLVFSAANGSAISVSDADGNLASVRVTVTNGKLNVALSGGATISAGANGSSTLTISGTQASINATLNGLTYTPTNAFTGTATLTVLSTDSTAVTPLTNSSSFNVTVSANSVLLDLDANNSSTATGNDYISTFTEAGTYVANSGGARIADTDVTITTNRSISGATIRIATNYQAGADKLEFANQNGITGTFDAASGTLTLSGTKSVAEYRTALGSIRFNNSSDAPSTAARTITVVVRDDGGAQSGVARTTMNVVGTNDAPVSTNDAVTTPEDTPRVLALTDFGGFSDPDGTPIAAVQITSLPAAGTLQYDSTGNGTWVAVSASQTVTAADISAGRLRFSPAQDANGAAYASVGFKVSDGTALSAAAYTLTVNVTAVNDAPVANPDTASVNEDATLNVSIANGMIRGAGADTDVDSAASTLVVSGAVAGAGGVVQGAGVGSPLAGTYGTLTVATDGSFSYVANNANALAAGVVQNDVFTYTVQDPNAAVSNTATLTIAVTGVNDAPVGLASTVTALSSTPYVFSAADFGFTDVDTGDSLSGVRIDSLPVAGTLTLGGVAVSAGQVLTAAQIAQLTFTPGVGAGGAGYATFGFSVRDQSNAFDASLKSMTVDVTGVNTPALISGTAAGSVIEAGGTGNATPGTPTAGGILTVSDPDPGEAIFQAPPTLDGTYGTFTFNPTSGAWGYTLDAGKSDALSQGQVVHDTLTVTSFDGTASRVIDVTVVGTDDAPVITGTFTGDVAEDGTLAATGALSIGDVDNPGVSFADVAATPGDNPDGTFGTFELVSGVWTYTLDNAAAQSLAAGQTFLDTYTFTATDGSTQQVSVIITGAEDASVITGTFTGNATEDGTLSTSGV
ncbi:MAG: VCBS domain-containing protein, partial [Betaproteobacteria bacterium]